MKITPKLHGTMDSKKRKFKFLEASLMDKNEVVEDWY